jgi:putative nucleotidyltransferase with HDIG domain
MEKPLKRVLPGATLARDVADSTGRILYPAGATLTESAIEALAQRGVTDVDVAGDFAPLNPALLVKATERAQRYYARLDMAVPPGPILFGLRVEAEALRMERGLPALLRDCKGTPSDAPGPEDLPAFSLENFEPPQLSAVAAQLNHELTQPEPTSRKVVEIIGMSPGLTARLLRLVNSPLYGGRGKVETVSRAVAIVGLREVGMLAAGLLMVDRFGVIPSSVVDMRTFLEHSLACALASRELARATGLMDAEQAFVAGLLHDIGRLYYFTAFPERSRYCMAGALARGRSLLEEEARYFGRDHASMGCRLLEGWGMPSTLVQAVAHHHDPLRAADPMPPGVIHLADSVVHAMGLGSSGECGPPAFRPGFAAMVPLAADQLADIASSVGEKLDAIVAAFH